MPNTAKRNHFKATVIAAAIAVLRRLCAEQPDFQSAFVNLAVTLCEAGHLLQAERLYQEMARRWPDFAAAVNRRKCAPPVDRV